MIPNDDEVRYKNIINLLKQMPKVSAPPNFESDLMRRINIGNFNDTYKIKWWDRFLFPTRIIAATTLAISIVAVFYVLNDNSVDKENPFLLKPPIRKSVLQSQNKQLHLSKTPEYAEASINGSFKINKEGLNFLHIRLNEAEKAKITRLKEQIRAYFNENR
ncbi:MAG: hypothetical protein P4L35_15715 [Ignavibacteriaceae bacterium]|nr:hypothetical protein [Ignavibacteriaceae bacterium]